MKKIVGILTCALLLTLLPSCMYGSGDVKIESDGSGSFAVRVGIEKSVADRIENAAGYEGAKEELAGGKEFEYNGTAYVGKDSTAAFASIAELNGLLKSEETAGADAGDMRFTLNSDGSLKLSLSLKNTDASFDSSQIDAAGTDFSAAELEELAKKRVIIYSFAFPGSVRQTAGTAEGVSIENGKLTLDMVKLCAAIPNGETRLFEFESEAGAIDMSKAILGEPELSVEVKGKAVVWTDVKPFIDENNRTMVPLRAVGDALGLTVDWDEAAREAIFKGAVGDETRTIRFPIDQSTALTESVKGETATRGSVTMDTASVIVNSRTFAPVRYLAEFFDYKVGWDGESMTVLID